MNAPLRHALELDLLAKLEESEWWEAARIERGQQRRLEELTRHAVGTVPFYRGRVADFNALPILTRAAKNDELGGYALLYLGRAQLALSKIADARASADRLLQAQPTGYLADAALWLTADVAEAAGDWPAAVTSLQTLVVSKPLEPEVSHGNRPWRHEAIHPSLYIARLPNISKYCLVRVLGAFAFFASNV